MLTSSQQLMALETRNKAQFNKVSDLEFTHQKPPRYPHQETSEQKQTQKIQQKRYKHDDSDSKANTKVSLPSLPNIKKMEISAFEMLPKNTQHVVNYGNGLKIASRLPRLDGKSEVPRQKHSSNGPQARQHDENTPVYCSVTPERRQQSPDRQLTLNKKRLLNKSCCLGQFAMKTKAGCQPNKNPKTNQDAAIVFPQVLDHVGMCMLAVCDGHGVNGHFVSNFIKQVLPKYIEQQVIKEDNMKSALIRAFQITNQELCDSDIDTALSGSTTVSLIIKKDVIWSANVGDSRAIMCRCTDEGWKVIELSRDHKPDCEEEKVRVLEAGGRVEAQRDFYGNPIGPERVWLQYCDAPGLAMTRSMGDKIGAQAGVIAEPEILEYSITAQDRCLIIASDGVWEYLSNEDVMNVVVPYIEKDNVDMAGDRLLAESISAWKRHSLSRDDITCIVVHLKQQ